MQLTGLALQPLLAVLGAAALLTVGLYLLKLRRRVVPVPFIGLWESLLQDRKASRLFARLRHLVSLLLALVVVTLLCLALGDLRPRAADTSARHVLVLIDAGLSMQATDVRPSRLQAALARARALVRSAGPGLALMVAQMDESTSPLSSMSEDPRELLGALELVAPTDLTTDYRRAYRFALDILRGQEGAEVALLSDRAADPEPELAAALARAHVRVSYVPVGRRGDDVGISAFAARRYPLDKNRGELLLELWSGSTRPRDVELTLLGDGQPVDVQRITLQPGKSVRRIYDDVTGASRTLEARLHVGGGDDLATDDRAYAVLPEQRRIRVLCVSEGNRYLEAALLLDEYLDVDLVTPARYAGTSGYDVVIFDRTLPKTAPGIAALYLDAQGEGASPLVSLGEIAHPRFDKLDANHPVLRYSALRDVNVGRAQLVRPSAQDAVLAADARGPLLVAGTRAGHAFLALTFDVRESDLPLRAAWPLLLLNGLDWLTAAEREEPSSSTVGATLSLTLPSSVKNAELIGPDGRRRKLDADGGKVTLHFTRAGFYRLRAGDDERVIAVSLPADAARDLTPRSRLQVGRLDARRPELRSVSLRHPPWALMLVIALLLLTAEWATYHRRWTV
ncbi:MAG: VWA domain-containing protein [Polyangiales bacterium]